MQRISRIGQRISDGVSLEPGALFGGRRGVRMMADRGQHGEGQHHQRDVLVPVMPGAGFVDQRRQQRPCAPF